jgi:hypothetical protein
MDDVEVIENAFYDLGYFEGVRNTFQIFSKGFANFNVFEDSASEKIEFVLKEMMKELEDAKDCHKDSDRHFTQRQADEFYN